jgi:NAD(P)-dependent dehydrogenase (short-subunit alcohol dehydrogenase family)
MTDFSPQNIMIVGASGGIGGAFVDYCLNMESVQTLHACTRRQWTHTDGRVHHHFLDYEDENSIQAAVEEATKDAPLDLVIVATGLLHDGADLQPEKSLRDLSADKFQRDFLVNTIGPALFAKYAAPKLNRDHKAVFAVLSARVGSISDNHLGGWYAYRASKAALNMVLKNTAIEIARTNKNAVIMGLHPGTVDTDLSKPFQGQVKEGKLFTPDYSVEKMMESVTRVDASSNGQIFAWDGEVIPA